MVFMRIILAIMDIFLGHNEDNFLKFWPELSLTYAVNFFKGSVTHDPYFLIYREMTEHFIHYA